MKKLIFANEPNYVLKKGFKTITIKFIFPFLFKEEHLFDYALIRLLLLNSTEDYPDEKLFNAELLKRMIIKYSIKIDRYNDNMFMHFTLTIPDPKEVSIFSLDDAFSFFIDAIYKPNIDKNSFKEEPFLRERDYIYSSNINARKSISSSSYEKFMYYFDDSGKISNNVYNNIEKIKEVNPESLYEYYKEIIFNNEPIIYVYGDTSENEVGYLFKKYFNHPKKEISIETNYTSYLKVSKHLNHIEETHEFNESVLYMGYKVEDMVEEEEKDLILVKNILATPENDLIFKTLRLDNNLVYSSNVNCNARHGAFIISTQLQEKNKEKAINLIKDVMESLKDKEFVKTCIDKLLVGIKYELLSDLDSKFHDLNTRLDKDFSFSDSLEDIYNYYENIDIDKFIQFVDKIKLDTIFFLRGDSNEK